jgi:hypothetical protein
MSNEGLSEAARFYVLVSISQQSQQSQDFREATPGRIWRNPTECAGNPKNS